MKMDKLGRLRLVAKPDHNWVSFDLKDGFYDLSIAPPQNSDAFTVNVDG